MMIEVVDTGTFCWIYSWMKMKVHILKIFWADFCWTKFIELRHNNAKSKLYSHNKTRFYYLHKDIKINVNGLLNFSLFGSKFPQFESNVVVMGLKSSVLLFWLSWFTKHILDKGILPFTLNVGNPNPIQSFR